MFKVMTVWVHPSGEDNIDDDYYFHSKHEAIKFCKAFLKKAKGQGLIVTDENLRALESGVLVGWLNGVRRRPSPELLSNYLMSFVRGYTLPKEGGPCKLHVTNEFRDLPDLLLEEGKNLFFPDRFETFLLEVLKQSSAQDVLAPVEDPNGSWLGFLNERTQVVFLVPWSQVQSSIRELAKVNPDRAKLVYGCLSSPDERGYFFADPHHELGDPHKASDFDPELPYVPYTPNPWLKRWSE